MLSLSIIDHLKRNLFVLLAFAWMITVLLAFSIGKAEGEAREKDRSAAALSALREEHATQGRRAAEESLLRYRQQVTRANQSEQSLLNAQDQIADLKRQLSERIPHVSTNFRPARGAVPVPAPFVVTCGWLRDYNIAHGADLPAPAACRATPGTAEAAWPAPGSDTELLESGVSAADLLAHARDYGAWALANLAHLNALLDLHNKESP
ncbi:lysis protein [Pseudomonas sp. A46]|nr:lysis protein [Pseudomonas sp. A46]OWJ91103.1 lysis protein [Pseudomonas sp. A46]